MLRDRSFRGWEEARNRVCIISLLLEQFINIETIVDFLDAAMVIR